MRFLGCGAVSLGKWLMISFFKDYDYSMITPDRGSCYNPA